MTLIEQAKSSFDMVLSQSGLSGSQGTCLYACVFLVSYLAKFTECTDVTIKGGSGSSGVLIDGQWRGHYWVEGKVGNVDWLFDLTIDQFYSGLRYIAKPKDEIDIIYSADLNTDIAAHIADLNLPS